MKTHRLIREQFIPLHPEEVFPFFADARNLESLTPPWLNFQILTPGEIEMHVGAVIQYALRVHLMPVRWTTVITTWRPPFEFVDVQLRGPYALWHHRHTFESVDGGTRMTDEVHYGLPFGWAGQAAHAFFVRRDLDAIFGFRAETVTRHFTVRSATVAHSISTIRQSVSEK